MAGQRLYATKALQLSWQSGALREIALGQESLSEEELMGKCTRNTPTQMTPNDLVKRTG